MFRILVATMVGAVFAQDRVICPVINGIGQCQALGGCIIPVPSVFREWVVAVQVCGVWQMSLAESGIERERYVVGFAR